MKILLISNMYPSNENPTYGVFVKNFKDQMEKQKFDVTQTALIRGRGKNKFEKIVKYIKFFRDVMILIKQNEYDLIYVHYINHSLLPLLFVQKYIKKPLILNAHGSDVFVNNRIKKYIQNLVTPIIIKANTIVVPSSYFKDVIHNKFHIEKNKIFVSPSGGIDTDLFKPLKKTKDTSELIIGYVSRIDEGKGWDILLQAIKVLRDKGIVNFKVLMIGGGSQEQLLLKMIETLNIEENVDFIGRVSHEDLVDYYNKMDVFAFTTTLAESLGLVGLEAMACGVPVIGSDIGGLKGYIENGTNGDLFEPGNINELSEHMKNFIFMDKNSLEQYAIHSVATAKQYDSNIVSQNMSNKLKTVLNQGL